MTDGTDEEAVRALFARYGAAFDDSDSSGVTDLFVWPATIWQFGKGHVFASATEFAQNVEALIDVLDEASILSTQAEVREVHVEGAAAFASVLWRQRDGEGALLHEFVCQYLLVHQLGGWRIATIVNGAAG